MGIVSISLYIWHYLLINIVGTQSGLRAVYTVTDGLTANDWIRGSLFLVIAVGISVASYYAIERPCMGWLRRRLVARLCPLAPRSPALGKA